MANETPSLSIGKQSFDLAQRIKAMLSPMEDVCRYREQRSNEFAQYDVTPRNKAALPFTIAIAPGGINLECALATIHELPLDQGDIAVALVEAILNGRLHFIRRMKANGKPRVTKAYFIDAAGKMIFKHRKSNNWLPVTPAAVSTERLRYAAYRD